MGQFSHYGPQWARVTECSVFDGGIDYTHLSVSELIKPCLFYCM